MLTVLVTILLLLVALLAIPVSLTFKASFQDVFQGYIRLHWAFGLVRVQLLPSQSKTPSSADKNSRPKRDRSKRARGKMKHGFTLARDMKLRRRVFRFIGDLWHAVGKQDVRLHVRVGLGDPADTGMLWAAVGPLSGVLANIQEATIEIEPEFIDAIFEFDSHGKLRIIPLQLVYLFAALLLSPSIWRAFMRKAG